ncbi:MAG: hypothetical protein JSW27_06310 [Phycisphaerales bacterium]|nr:MAG: hypothetical protein JSW27_06310 [Phycisphaerales bacterium]
MNDRRITEPNRARRLFLRLLCLSLLRPLLVAPGPVLAARDIVLEGVYEAALDLPRIHFLLQRSVPGSALKSSSGLNVHDAFLDTGASGILLSKETAQELGVALAPQAQFVDVGVGGAERFSVSEPLLLGLAGYESPQARDPRAYQNVGRGRFQVKHAAGLLGQAVDVIGMPALYKSVVVLNTGATNDLSFCGAALKEPEDRSIPTPHVTIKLRFVDFSNRKHPDNVPPLPVLAPNPVIDGLVLHHRGRQSKGNWLLDTGGTISLISTHQARQLGIGKDQTPAFTLPVGGVGSMTTIPGYQFDRLVIPTLNDRHLVFTNVRLGVHDITYVDEATQTERTLDGVFGSNFLCASAKMEGLLPGDINQTLIDKVVIDMPEGILALRFDPRLSR